MTDRIALVLGATGGIGGETAAALQRHGWRIRALTRNPDEARKRPVGAKWEWVQGDAMVPEDVLKAAGGVDVIVHAANPAAYRNWDTTVLPMFESVIAAAKAADARIIAPGSFYTFSYGSHFISETTPQKPTTRKGRIRVQVEERLQAASEQGVRSLILRAADFFGPRPGSNWFSQGLIKPGKPVQFITYPGNPGVGHSWAYLPDLAETFARLADRESELPPFATFNFEGFWDPDGTAMIAAIKRVVRNPKLKVKKFPWWFMPVAGMFNVTMREMVEMKGLWENPSHFDNKKLVAFLGEEPRTPIDDAVRTTLKGLGSLPK